MGCGPNELLAHIKGDVMNITFNWSIQQLVTVKKGDDFIVEFVYWSCSASNGQSTQSVNSIIKIPFNNADFVKYEDLTMEAVMNWVFELIGQEKKEQIEIDLSLNLSDNEDLKTFVKPLPWA